MENMTTKVSAFVRYYHMVNSNIKIYNDKYANMILSKDEYDEIYKNMEKGINFFNPSYVGDNPVRYIVNNFIGQTVLGRSAVNYKYLLNEIKLGLKQYVILGSGYDTSGYLVNDTVKVFELDKSEVIEDKNSRIKKTNIDNRNVKYISCDFNKDWINSLISNNFDCTKKSMFSILGVSYYLDKNVFFNMLESISNIVSQGSIILFDYPNKYNDSNKNKVLAGGSGEEMKSYYKEKDIFDFCDRNNMYVVENIGKYEIDNEYFYDYNTLNPNNKIFFNKNINICVLIKK